MKRSSIVPLQVFLKPAMTFAILASLMTLNCRSTIGEDAEVKSGFDIATGLEQANTFRGHFFNVISNDMTDDRKRLALYQPTPELLSSPEETDPADFLEKLSETHREIRPHLLYEAGKLAESTAEKFDPQLFVDYPVTFVLVPGVFGEFIETRPMEELLIKTDSPYAMEFLQKLREAKKEDAYDRHFQLSKEKDVSVSLGKLINPVSFEDPVSGKTEFKFIGLGLPSWGLESLGTNANAAGIYLRRLTKFFNIVGTPKNIVFVGYSRGTPIALEMMSKVSSVSWGKEVKGIITLGGIVFGSDLADESLVKGTVLHRQVKAIKNLKRKLKTLKPVPSNLSFFAKNTLRAKNAATIGRNAKIFLSFFRAVAKQDPGSSSEDGLGGGTQGDPMQISRIMSSTIKNLGIDNLVGGKYSQSIRKVKILCGKVIEAIVELRTENRLEWWRTHKVPTNGVRYYSIVGTMADSKTSPMKKLAENSISYYPKSSDYKTLIKNYRGIATTTGFYLNDSQVPIHKAIFWPKLISLLNPNQPKLKTHFLGVLGTHHWAFALESVRQELTGYGNPFPRISLMRAFARQITTDLEKGN